MFNLNWNHQYLYPASNINIKQPNEPISRHLKYFSLSSQEIDYFEVQELSTISQKVTIATEGISTNCPKPVNTEIKHLTMEEQLNRYFLQAPTQLYITSSLWL